MDLIGPLHRTDRGNEYIVVMQDHFMKWIEGAAVATKQAMLVADVIVNEWVYKHGTPLNLPSNRGTEFTAAMHRCLCDLLRSTRPTVQRCHGKVQPDFIIHAENCGKFCSPIAGQVERGAVFVDPFVDNDIGY